LGRKKSKKTLMKEKALAKARKMLIEDHESAHAWFKNGVKWFLFLFYDLGAVLGFAFPLDLLAVSTLLEPA